jgi:hypothetical protein
MRSVSYSPSFSFTDRTFPSMEWALSRRSSILISVDTRFAPSANGTSCIRLRTGKIASRSPSMIVPWP